MALYGSPSVTPLLIGGYSMLPMKVQGISDKVKAHQQETTGLADGWPEFTPTGMQKATIKLNGGFYDNATTSMHTALRDALQTSRVMCYSVEGGTVGKAFIGAAGIYGMEYELLAKVGELTKANVEHQVSGQRYEGAILHALGARTTTGNSDAGSVDNAASSANGGVGFLQVTAASGITSVTVTLRHSTDNSTFANVTGGAFTAVTPAGAPTAQTLAVTGTINRYMSVAWSITGAGSVTFFVGFARL